MKRILLLSLGCLALTACGPKHVRDEVRQVEIGDTIISDGWQDIVYTPNVDLSGLDYDTEPTLYVNLTDVETGTVFKVPLGYECSQFPLPKGERFLTRFDITAYEEKPQEQYMSPYSDPVAKHLCS